MSSDVNSVLGKGCTALQQACQIALETDLKHLHQGSTPNQSSQSLLLILLVGILSSLLGYITFCILVWHEEKAMLDAKTKDPIPQSRREQTNNGAEQAQQSSLTTDPPTSLTQAVEYEAEYLVTPPSALTPRPTTPSAFTRPPIKMAAEIEDGRQASQPSLIYSVQTNVRPPPPPPPPLPTP